MVDIEKDIIPIIQEHSTYFRYVRQGVYHTRCPFCGDSQKNLRTGHMYLLMNNGICRCYCHKCNTNVALTNDVLKKFIGPHNFNISEQKVHKINPSNPNNNVETDVLKKNTPEYQYIIGRIGCDISPDEMISFRVIANQEAFFKKYGISKLNPIPNCVTFLSADGNTMCHRCLTENDDFRWLKRKIYQNYESTPYVIRTGFDILSNDQQVVCIAEGIFDILGVYKNITNKANLYAATLGKDYTRTIKWMISKGIFGKNIAIYVFSDRDFTFQKIKSQLKPYRWLYKEIGVIYNAAYDDFGTNKDNIIIEDPIYI